MLKTVELNFVFIHKVVSGGETMLKLKWVDGPTHFMEKFVKNGKHEIQHYKEADFKEQFRITKVDFNNLEVLD